MYIYTDFHIDNETFTAKSISQVVTYLCIWSLENVRKWLHKPHGNSIILCKKSSYPIHLVTEIVQIICVFITILKRPSSLSFELPESLVSLFVEVWTQIHDSANWKQRLRKAGKFALISSVFHGLDGKLCLCMCRLHVTRHFSLTQVAQKFCGEWWLWAQNWAVSRAMNKAKLLPLIRYYLKARITKILWMY